MQVTSLDIPDVKIIRPKKFGDNRGFFSETYNKRDFSNHGIDIDFVQDNHSLSEKPGTLRGLHFQTPPYAQDKLVRVLKGSILDVAVDLRSGSPTYGKHVTAVISGEEWNQILVPIGFAHGVLTLEPGTELLYKVSNYYAPDHDKGLFWNDPALGIEWRMSEDDVVLSEKDSKQPMLADLEPVFEYS